MQINVINKQSTHTEYSHRTHIEPALCPGSIKCHVPTRAHLGVSPR